jgi:predicted TIM-barrel fold metal-dependent hydrolase
MATLETMHGRVMDLDSHEMVPFDRVEEVFGKRGIDMLMTSANFSNRDTYNQGYAFTEDLRDSTPITQQTTWETKGSAAPGVSDFDRRPAVLDAMGINRQLVFPGMGLVAMVQAQGGLLSVTSEAGLKAAWAALDAHNEWAAGVTNKYDRLRVVGVVPTVKPGVTADSITKEAARQIKTGIKAVMIDSSRPPAGVSPAHTSLDAFYATLAEANVPLIIHPPAGLGFMHQDWPRADPWTTAAQSHWMAADNFIRSLVLGGVFERHPSLRFGAIELGAEWFGPMADAIDHQIVDKHKRPHRPGGYPLIEGGLKMKPSEYLARNVRVTPYLWERTDEMLQDYPHLQDCYCFSSDYPHGEGGPWANKQFFDEIKSLGDKAVEKFFVTNAELILPA